MKTSELFWQEEEKTVRKGAQKKKKWFLWKLRLVLGWLMLSKYDHLQKMTAVSPVSWRGSLWTKPKLHELEVNAENTWQEALTAKSFYFFAKFFFFFLPAKLRYRFKKDKLQRTNQNLEGLLLWALINFHTYFRLFV